jgi:hypothetical protein
MLLCHEWHNMFRAMALEALGSMDGWNTRGYTKSIQRVYKRYTKGIQKDTKGVKGYRKVHEMVYERVYKRAYAY